MARLRKASVSNIIIERTLKLVTVTIKSARPGVIIGKGGTEVDKLFRVVFAAIPVGVPSADETKAIADRIRLLSHD